MMSHAATSRSLAASRQVCVALCVALNLARRVLRLLIYQRYAMFSLLSARCCSITIAPQASRAALDIARAEADFACEASMRDGRKWDASTTELSRALSLHTSESGRQTVGGSRRVAAAEAAVAFEQAQSTCALPLHFPLQFEYVCRRVFVLGTNSSTAGHCQGHGELEKAVVGATAVYNMLDSPKNVGMNEN
jgi:hypothetical protein